MVVLNNFKQDRTTGDNSVVNKHVEIFEEDKMFQIIYKELTNYIKTKHNKHE